MKLKTKKEPAAALAPVSAAITAASVNPVAYQKGTAKSLPFSAGDLQGLKLKKANKPVVEGTTDSARGIRPVNVSTLPVAAELSVRRPALKAFSSTDLRLVKLTRRGGDKPAPAKSVPKQLSTPSAKPSKALSLKSALKNAIKTKFFKAKGSPDAAATESDSDNEWSQ